MSLTSPNHDHTSYMDIINVTLDPKHCATHFLHLDFGDSQLKSMKAETLTAGPKISYHPPESIFLFTQIVPQDRNFGFESKCGGIH